MCGCVLWVPRVSTHFSPKLLVLLIAQDAPRKMLCVDKTLGILHLPTLLLGFSSSGTLNWNHCHREMESNPFAQVACFLRV